MSSRHPTDAHLPTRRAAVLTMAAFAAPGLASTAALAAEACSAAEATAFAIHDRYVAIVNGRAPERMREVCVEDYIQHSGRSPNGIAAQVENFRQILARWPDLVIHVDDRIFGDGKLVARNTF